MLFAQCLSMQISSREIKSNLISLLRQHEGDIFPFCTPGKPPPKMPTYTCCPAIGWHRMAVAKASKFSSVLSWRHSDLEWDSGFWVKLDISSVCTITAAWSNFDAAETSGAMPAVPSAWIHCYFLHIPLRSLDAATRRPCITNCMKLHILKEQTLWGWGHSS